jgi:simple sugar transport system ATP-binding protein
VSDERPLIRLEGLSKAFGPVYANRDITLDIRAGKIKSLLGENGAGKSTLMGMLAGRLQPDGGRILIDGRPHRFASARDAINEGIGMVYQHFMLVEAMTVTENIFLGHPGGMLLDAESMERQVAQLARDVRLAIDPSARVSTLSMGEKQRVEILKLLFRRNRVLIFDEPTAVLTPQEADQLFEALRQMAVQGKAIVFISHKLDEVMALSDEIAVLRKGQVVADMTADTVHTKEELAQLMVGREVILQVERQPLETRQTVLRVSGLNDRPLKEINLTVRQGEILGLVGVAGNGQKPLVETICGLRVPASGRVRLMGQDWSRFYRRRRWDGNLSYVPEDRQGLATCRNLSLTENFMLTTRQGFCRGPWLRRRQAEKRLVQLIDDFDIQPPNPGARARQLSGGNLQKMVLAREFYRRPRLIVAEQPTQGLDVAATEDVWKVLLKARSRAGILLVTGDLAEALSLADRLAVMFDGRIVDTFDADDRAKIDRIGLMMAGVAASGSAEAAPSA